MASLNWPLEAAGKRCAEAARWHHAGSNYCLDFHGDPVAADIVVFSDGNHHMALGEALSEFVRATTGVDDVFYTTTPPSVFIQALGGDGLCIGNLRLRLHPDVLISPADILERLSGDGYVPAHQPFMRSRGNVLLVRKGNPKAITRLQDLLKGDVSLFISNPKTEAASFSVYASTLEAMATEQGVTLNIRRPGGSMRIVYGERIHHREAPQALADGKADVAMVYYHLALRYTRIFPDLFEYVVLDDVERDNASPGNVTTVYHLGIGKDAGRWAGVLRDFLSGEHAAAIYRGHGLSPAA